MLNYLVLQYLAAQKQLNLAILLPQYILNYQQNSNYDIIANIKRHLQHDLAQADLNELIIEKVFVSKAEWIDKLLYWSQLYFDKTKIEQQRLDIIKKMLSLSITTQVTTVNITSDLLLLQLAQLEYDRSQMSEQGQSILVQGFYQYYEQSDWVPEVRVINGDDLSSGLEVSCYIINQTCAIFCFRGSQTKFFQTMLAHDFQQSRLDWQYNLKAIVHGSETSQYQQAIRFIQEVYTQYPTIQQSLATGHSLGGHLVQLIQLIHGYFDDYVICNTSPLQLKQLFLLQPDKFTSSQWQQLFNEQDKSKLFKQWHIQSTGRIYQYTSDLINIACEVPQTFYYGQRMELPALPYYHYQPYLQQCFTSLQIQQLATWLCGALDVKVKQQYDFVTDVLQTLIFNLLSHEQWQVDNVQLVVSLLKYLRLNQWLSADAHYQCLEILKQYQVSFDVSQQFNYLKRTKLIFQLQYQLYRGLNIDLLKAIASMHRISGHWLTLEERENNEYFN